MEQNTGILVRNRSPEDNFWALLTRAESSSILPAEAITPVHENLQSGATCGKSRTEELTKESF